MIRNALIVLPPAAKASIELSKLFAPGDLRFGVLLLQIVELPHCVDDIQEISRAAVISRRGQI